MDGGRFVTFEGGEGAGKTTLIARVAERLIAEGVSVITTREPGAGPIGAAIRTVLLESGAISKKAELFLFLADRANHVETVVRPALAKGQTVLCDRYADSSYVYQAVVGGLSHEFVGLANEFATGGLTPHRTFLLDLDPAIGLGRVTEPNRVDRMPTEFHRRVRDGFRQLASAEPERWRVIDASQTAEEVLRTVLADLLA